MERFFKRMGRKKRWLALSLAAVGVVLLVVGLSLFISNSQDQSKRSVGACLIFFGMIFLALGVTIFKPPRSTIDDEKLKLLKTKSNLSQKQIQYAIKAVLFRNGNNGVKINDLTTELQLSYGVNKFDTIRVAKLLERKGQAILEVPFSADTGETLVFWVES